MVDKATQTPQKMPMFCRKERELRQPNVLECQQCQQEEEAYVGMKGREEGGQTASVVRRVTFEETPVECKRGQVPAASPEKCLTPRLSTSKHTPIAFMDDPKSPDPSPLRADASSSSPEVGNSPQLAVRSPRSPSVGEDMTSFVDSFVASILLEEQCATAAAAGNTTAAAEAASQLVKHVNFKLYLNLKVETD